MSVWALLPRVFFLFFFCVPIDLHLLAFKFIFAFQSSLLNLNLFDDTCAIHFASTCLVQQALTSTCT